MHPGIDGGICATIINRGAVMIFVYIFIAVVLCIVVSVALLYWGKE